MDQIKNGPFVIGWIGTPSTQKYVIEIAAALSKLQVFGFIVILINLFFEDVNFVHPYMFYFSFYILILVMKVNDRYISNYS